MFDGAEAWMVSLLGRHLSKSGGGGVAREGRGSVGRFGGCGAGWNRGLGTAMGGRVCDYSSCVISHLM